MQLARAFRNFARIPFVGTQTEPLEMKWDLSIDPAIFRLRLKVSEDRAVSAIIVGPEFAIVILKESSITSRILKKEPLFKWTTAGNTMSQTGAGGWSRKVVCVFYSVSFWVCS